MIRSKNLKKRIDREQQCENATRCKEESKKDDNKIQMRAVKARKRIRIQN